MTSDDAARVRVLYERLHTLRDQVSATTPENADKPGHPGSGLSVLVDGFNRLLTRTRAIAVDDQLLLEVLEDVQPIPEFQERLAASYHMKAKQRLIFDINSILQALGVRLVSATGAPSNVSVDREGLFVAGQRFDALLAATRILVAAQTCIALVDGYISQNVLELISAKAENAAVQILTKPATLPGNILVLANAFNQQYGQKGRLSIRTSTSFHDRFLIIDDDQFYHFGASLKDLGGRGFMFSRIEEPRLVALLRESIDDEWAKAAIVV